MLCVICSFGSIQQMEWISYSRFWWDCWMEMSEISNNNNNQFQFVWQCNQQQQVYQIIPKPRLCSHRAFRVSDSTDRLVHCAFAQIEFYWRLMSISLPCRAWLSIAEYFLKCVAIHFDIDSAAANEIHPFGLMFDVVFVIHRKFKRLFYEFISYIYT